MIRNAAVEEHLTELKVIIKIQEYIQIEGEGKRERVRGRQQMCGWICVREL